MNYLTKYRAVLFMRVTLHRQNKAIKVTTLLAKLSREKLTENTEYIFIYQFHILNKH